MKTIVAPQLAFMAIVCMVFGTGKPQMAQKKVLLTKVDQQIYFFYDFSLRKSDLQVLQKSKIKISEYNFG